MPFEFKLQRRVEFSETDMAGIMHFSNFFRFMESAEHSFVRSLGFSVVMKQVEPPVGWPRVQVEGKFMQPVRFEDLIEVHLLVKKVSSRSLTYFFRIWRIDPAPRIEAAQGSITAVCVRKQPDGTMAATAIPKEFAAQLEEAPSVLLD